MKRLMISIILMSIPVWTSAGVYGQEPNQPDKNMAAPNQYMCPKHPEITASWPAKCPKCGMELQRRRSTRQMMSGRSMAENMRRRIMMNTPIDVFDPTAILGARKPLNLTQRQIEQLKIIAMTARQCSREVLTRKQRSELNSLRRLRNFPHTMTQMHRWMMQRMPSSGGMMMGSMGQQMSPQEPKGAGDPPAQTSDSKTAGRGMSGSGTPAGNTDRDTRARDSRRDRMRDRYRDRMRDRYRDLYRDRYRDRYPYYYPYDGFIYGGPDYGRYPGYYNPYYDDIDEDYGDDYGDNYEGFGDDEGFGGEQFGDEGFGEGSGNDEGFGNDEGLGGEQFGNEGFGEGRSDGEEGSGREDGR